MVMVAEAPGGLTRSQQPLLGDVLRELGKLTERDIPRIILRQRQTRQKFGEVAQSLGLVSREDVEYALRLNGAGVPTELHVYAGAPHGFDSLLTGAPIAQRARRAMNEWLERRLHP